MRIKRILALTLAVCIAVSLFCVANAGRYTYADERLNKLENTEIFLRSTIEHIFIGTINKQGKATGYHYEGCEGAEGCVVDGTRSEPDEFGVYMGCVEVSGIRKSGNRGYSTFFPNDRTPQEIIDDINEAYDNAENISGNTWQGVCDEGYVINMYLTDDGLIISAFPEYLED